MTVLREMRLHEERLKEGKSFPVLPGNEVIRKLV